MALQRTLPSPAALAAALLLAACGSTPPAAGGVRLAAPGGEPPAFAADADALRAELESWRGLRFRDELVVELVPADHVEDPKLNGWYESRTKRLVVVEGKSDAMGRGTLLHEMFHALQDQHFDLARLHREAEPLGPDARRALRALIEGEAMLAVSELMSYDFERHAKLPAAGPLDPERFEKLFHYGAGLRFVRALREAGGWERVDAAFRDPPRSTAEILHPERYPRRERALPPGWRGDAPADARARGELELWLLLAGPTELRPRAAELAAHLRADVAWEAGAGLKWRLLFDAPGAAAEAAAAAEMAGARAAVDGALVTLVLES
ncbi:MAG: hypothetical protein AAF682_23080 [Planctomycetota bacterium]